MGEEFVSAGKRSTGRISTKQLTCTAVMAALLCVLGPLSIEIGPVPISLATFVVYLAGAVLGWKWGTMAVLIYLLLGMAGVPVFAGFSGGAAKVAGVTGGYLVGYLPCALITGLGGMPALPFAGGEAKKKTFRLQAAAGARWRIIRLALFMVLGTVVLYLTGTAWFMLQTGNGLAASLGLCVYPFLAGDALKIIAAVLIASPVKLALGRMDRDL